jgi:hypothetical protein
MDNIIEPSKVISDQYGTEQIGLKHGSTVSVGPSSRKTVKSS